MVMGRGPSHWIMVALFAVGDMLFVSNRPDSYEEHRTRVIEPFHLDDDVVFSTLRSGWSRYGDGFLHADIQLTDAQYADFARHLDDPDGWGFVPMEHDDQRIVGPAEPGWNTWHDRYGAVLVDLDESPFGERTRARERGLRDEPTMVIRWASLGHPHPPGSDSHDHSRCAYRSMCWAWGELDGVSAARPCTAYPPTGGRPEVVVQAVLDDTTRRLIVSIP